jgi:hypothetical protein
MKDHITIAGHDGVFAAYKNSHVEVLRFLLIPHREEMRDEKAFACHRRIRQIHGVASLYRLSDAAGVALSFNQVVTPAAVRRSHLLQQGLLNA